MPHFKPPNIKNPNIAFKVASDLQTTCSRSPRCQRPPRSSQPPINGSHSHPLGTVAHMPSRSLQSTAAPLSTAPCLMALLSVDNLHGPTYSAPLRPRSIPGRFRPTQPRVDVPALRHCAAAVSIQVDKDPSVSRYDLPKVGVLPQQCRGLGHAIAASGAQLQQSMHISHHTTYVYKSFESYKRPRPKAKLQDTNMLKVLIYITWCLRRNLD
jgi:hypothetical protein